jgi:hypothetical protein
VTDITKSQPQKINFHKESMTTSKGNNAIQDIKDKDNKDNKDNKDDKDDKDDKYNKDIATKENTLNQMLRRHGFPAVKWNSYTERSISEVYDVLEIVLYEYPTHQFHIKAT